MMLTVSIHMAVAYKKFNKFKKKISKGRNIRCDANSCSLVNADWKSYNKTFVMKKKKKKELELVIIETA